MSEIFEFKFNDLSCIITGFKLENNDTFSMFYEIIKKGKGTF